MTETKVAKKNGARDLAESTFTGLNVDPRKIVVQDGFNVRDFSLKENQEHVESLARSIAEVGVQTPVVVRFEDGKLILVDGESRLRGTLLAIKNGADIKTIPATQEQKSTDEVHRIASLVTRNQGKQLTLLERGEVFARLEKFGWKHSDIAAAIGMTPANVSHIFKLYNAPEEVKKLVRAGAISESHAINVVREHGDNAADILKQALEVAKADGKEKATAKHVKKNKSAAQRAPYSFNAQEAKAMFGALVELYGKLPGNDNRKYRQVCIDVFENLYGSDWKPFIKEYAAEYGIAL